MRDAQPTTRSSKRAAYIPQKSHDDSAKGHRYSAKEPGIFRKRAIYIPHKSHIRPGTDS